MWNWDGQVGDGTKESKPFPVKIELENISDVEVGDNHSLAVDKTGFVWVWGKNDSAQIGDGTRVDKLEPIKLSGISDVVKVAPGYTSSLALKKDGTVWAWGAAETGIIDGKPSEGKYYLNPTQIIGLKDVVEISCGGRHGLALKKDGSVWTWGDSRDGILGIDYPNSYDYVPTKVQGLENIVQISAGYSFSVALKKDGTVFIWGADEWCDLADGIEDWNNAPEKVNNLSDIRQVASAPDAVYVLRNDGSIWTWGANYRSLYDDNEEFRNLVPTKIAEVSDAETVTAGDGHFYLTKKDGSIWAMGMGTLGDGWGYTRLVPIKILDTQIPPEVHIKIILYNRTGYYTKGWFQLSAWPYIKNGRTMVPLRFLSENLGFKVDWDSQEQKINIIGTKNVTLWIGKESAVIEGKLTSLDAPPEIIKGNTFVPVRFISEALGAHVQYDPEMKSIDITSG